MTSKVIFKSHHITHRTHKMIGDVLSKAVADWLATALTNGPQSESKQFLQVQCVRIFL